MVGAGSCNFPTDSCKFLIGDIGAQNFNFAPTFPQTGGFSAPNFVFFDENFPTERKFSDMVKFRCGGNYPCPATMSLCMSAMHITVLWLMG